MYRSYSFGTQSERAITFVRRLSVAAAFLAAALVTPESARCFPWSIDMFRGPAVGSLTRTPRNQPPGTLSESGAEPLSLPAAAKQLRNPFHATPATLRKGDALFQTYCSPCHGDDAKGDGAVSYLLRVPPADLTHGMPAAHSDGYIYATIRGGNAAMPPYGDAMSSNDTWAVIIYVRELQRRSNQRTASR